MVIPIPESAAHATLGFYEESVRMGRPCTVDLGFFRNPYVGRSFISPSQELRDLKVLCKFNPMSAPSSPRPYLKRARARHAMSEAVGQEAEGSLVCIRAVGHGAKLLAMVPEGAKVVRAGVWPVGLVRLHWAGSR